MVPIDTIVSKLRRCSQPHSDLAASLIKEYTKRAITVHTWQSHLLLQACASTLYAENYAYMEIRFV